MLLFLAYRLNDAAQTELHAPLVEKRRLVRGKFLRELEKLPLRFAVRLTV